MIRTLLALALTVSSAAGQISISHSVTAPSGDTLSVSVTLSEKWVADDGEPNGGHYVGSGSVCLAAVSGGVPVSLCVPFSVPARKNAHERSYGLPATFFGVGGAYLWTGTVYVGPASGAGMLSEFPGSMPGGVPVYIF